LSGNSFDVVTLTAPRPYCGDLTVTRELSVLATLPGREACRPDSKNARLEELAAPGEAWAPLAGPYFPSGGSTDAALQAEYLLALVWDLEGDPIAPGGPQRPRANWCAVKEGVSTLKGGGEGIMVYRDASELSRRTEESDAQAASLEMRDHLPDGRERLRSKGRGVAA
jgi:hypothetical protein